MKTNLIALKTQEIQTELPLFIEPILMQKLGQVGVEIYKSTYFNKFDNFNKSIFGLLENNTILLVDLTHPNIDEVLNQISKFYQINATDFSQGKFWKDETKQRICVLFDICNTNFAQEIDKNFLHTTFSPTKYVSTLKTFGLGESEIKKILQSIPNSYGFEFFLTSNFLDCQINILVDADFYKSSVLEDFIRKIYELLGNYIYADDDVSLYEKLMEGLSVRDLKIAICDNLTNGLFFCEIEKNITNQKDKICEFYNITKPSDLQIKLKIQENMLKNFVSKSDEVVYEMAYAVLQNSKANIAVVLSGTEKTASLAIGDNEIIHLYKFNFNHNKSLVYNIMIQNTIFKLLKKIKCSDKFFN